MSINETSTVGQLVVEHPSRARLFERLGIDYCCGGKKPLEQVCRDANLSFDAVCAELQLEQTADAPATRNWATASLTDLCDHIEQTHHRYLKDELPRALMLAEKVAVRHGPHHPALLEIRNLVKELKDEMESHMAKEEQVLFPMCRALDVADEPPVSALGTVANPIQTMIREHEHAGDAMAQIRVLSNGFACPPDACNTYRALFSALSNIELDLHEHVHKENNILFPRALRRENLLSRICAGA